MTDWRSVRPDPTEFPAYYGTYVGAVPDGDILDTLQREIEDTVALLRGVPEEKAGFRYADGKWSVREVIGHLIDAERVFGLRALWFARRDPTPQPSFDENAWADVSNADRRPLDDLTEEFAAVRRGTLTLYHGFDEDVVTRRGVASGGEFTVTSLAWIAAGHERHHKRVLHERYGV